jgi:kanamycin kinase
VLKTLQCRYGTGEWRRVTVGMSYAGVWTDDRVFIKIGPIVGQRDTGFSLRAEADRATWLRSVGLAAPEVLDFGTDGAVEWMVTRALTGRDASQPWPAEARDRVVDGLAEVAARLHSLPIEGCPFDRGLAVTIPDALHALENGLVNLVDLDAERIGMTGPDLAAQLLADRPIDEDLVVCHGDLSIPNVLFDPDTVEFTGFIDVGRVGTADRHADIGIVTRSLDSDLNPQYHPGGAARFLQRYQDLAPAAPIDAAKIDYYRLLDEFF